MNEEKQRRYDELYLDIATRISLMSHDTDHKVGSVIVRDNNILAFGFNGMPTGMNNNCKNANGSTKQEVIHAEANAICKLARSTGSSEGATLYSTLSPCVECAKLIMQSGITRIIFRETYKDEAGILLLLNNNKEVKGIKWKDNLSI
jgi:dCMP deaminase|tara:strand:+ start:6672 stop:7112 length:441 start_codon:yes stop_codon:yes gene_type:complete